MPSVTIFLVPKLPFLMLRFDWYCFNICLKQPTTNDIILGLCQTKHLKSFLWMFVCSCGNYIKKYQVPFYNLLFWHSWLWLIAVSQIENWHNVWTIYVHSSVHRDCHLIWYLFMELLRRMSHSYIWRTLSPGICAHLGILLYSGIRAYFD